MRTRDRWRWGGYPYPTDLPERVRRENLKAARDTPRVLRGGAFGYALRHMRCACRVRYDPFLRDRSWGFRVVVLPSS
jgi:formylglycine-generating enzyme required for sulfatase activity